MIERGGSFMISVSGNKSKIIKFTVLFIVIVLAVYGFNYYKDKNSNNANQSVRTVKAMRGNVVSTVSSTGTLTLEKSVDISSKVTGRITQVYVRENQEVRAGDILVKLDDSQLTSTLRQNEVKLANAQITYERSLALFRQGGIAKSQLDTDNTNYQVALNSYQISKDNLDDTVITTPISGVVIGKPISTGQTVAPGISTPMVLMVVGDLSSMQIEALVDESDIGKIKVGQNVKFSVDSFDGEVFDGVVRLVSKKSLTQQNVIYYTVYVKVLDTKGKLIPGMTARSNIMIEQSNDVIYIPRTAVKDVGKKKFVQIVTSENSKDGIKEVQVETGLFGENGIEIKSGLSEGDTVVMRSSKNKTPDSATLPRGGAGMRL